MPRKDPVTGVPVMTQAEFWAAEAEREGKGRQGFELMADMYAEIEADNEREANRLREPEAALELVKDFLDGYEDPYDCRCDYGFASEDVGSVIEVTDSEVGGSFGGGSAKLRIKLQLKDGSTRTVEWSDWYSSGSRLEPPDGDTSMTVVEADGARVRYSNELEDSLPRCEACQIFGGPRTLYGKLNPVAYLVPISSDGGQTIDRWSMCCVYHIHMYRKVINWHAPVQKLRREEAGLPHIEVDHG